jgi:hypothetical protein
VCLCQRERERERERESRGKGGREGGRENEDGSELEEGQAVLLPYKEEAAGCNLPENA